MSTYTPANRTAQWFSDDYGSATWAHPEVAVIHSTETTWWPGYKGGASAPNYTVRPDIGRRVLEWRAHYEDEESSRALVNLAGGVETNTRRAIQVELVGTCDPKHRTSWLGKGTRLAGRDYLYLPAAPAWYLAGLAAFVRDMNRRHGIPMVSPLTWRAYPSSYGATSTRMTFAEWRAFRGWCGHQHVPENAHGDPGNFPMGRVLDLARATTAPTPTPVRSYTVEELKQALREVLGEERVQRNFFQKHPIFVNTTGDPADTRTHVPLSTLLEAAARPAEQLEAGQ